MKRSILIYVWLAGEFHFILSAGWSNTLTLGSHNIPRLFFKKDIINNGFEYEPNQTHTVFFYNADSEEMYTGGNNIVLKLDVVHYRTEEELPLKMTGHQVCTEGPCEYVFTVIEKFQGSLFVCATNGYKPLCWKFSGDTMKSFDATGISPFLYTQNSLFLTVEDNLYAAAPMDRKGRSLQFRRKAGSKEHVWMYEDWILEPTFISAFWVERKEDPDNEKIYIFFREKNSDPNPEADTWISRVARVCKTDEGGPKRYFQNIWTSFLKARLACGFPEKSLYFNHLQDIYVLYAENWRDTKVYALFTSNWNSTAICIYSISAIDEIFENSTFKGYNNDIPNPRPGTCVKNSKRLPVATVNVVKNYPEMSDWVQSLHSQAPFYVSSINYTKIAVDRVQAADHSMYNILLLATDSGRIHKVLEAGSELFIISENDLPGRSPIQSIKLDSRKKKLVVGFLERIVDVNLQRCQDYNQSCEDCVLARDPYCAWTTFGCVPTVPGGIQNIIDGKTTVCPKPQTGSKEAGCIRTDNLSLSPRTNLSASPKVPFYLSCPIDSYHAVYTWEHQCQSSPCLQMQSTCLHLIPAVAEESYGTYMCVAKERDYTKVVKEYALTKQVIQNPNHTKTSNIPGYRNNAVAVVPQMVSLMAGPALAVVMGLFSYNF